ncbi:metallophosphoesterase [Hymenobacter metallilatus]|uniref:Serine/threonine protein phosphatase n=1 Tax=Hymenobacter metallilatus TaxID=2493666 RepID=A0A3R9MHP6_9BACT|nr:metallophosphoesterase [Hymenobacter metallilatus]RSK31722.1 serine/threonine protein phosphatase [Hymenobacter metallilatus]
MNLFIVGDVHGCYHTLRELLTHWQPATELLVQTGDLIDRGRFAPECVQLARELEAAHPGRTVFLRGNHELEMLKHYGPQGPNLPWLEWGGRATVQQYQARLNVLQPHLAWLSQRPLFWENEQVVVSHAGFADTATPLDPDNPQGVLWRRGPLRNLGRRQVVGHTPTTDGQTSFDATSNTLYVDTGAYLGLYLTAVRLTAAGELLTEFAVPTSRLDIAPV